MSRSMTKPTKWPVRPAKTVRPVWSEYSLCTKWVAKGSRFLHADSEDSDQTGQIPRLIWVFAGHTGHFVGFVMRWLIFVILYPRGSTLFRKYSRSKKSKRVNNFTPFWLVPHEEAISIQINNSILFSYTWNLIVWLIYFLSQKKLCLFCI